MWPQFQSDKGWLSWLDVSMGKMVRQISTRLGRLDVMTHNPANAVVCCGHAKGTVTMWTPNMEAPVAKMLCHTQPVRSVAIEQRGWYMATTGADSSLKIWDLRTYNCLQSYRMGCGPSNATFSQKGLLAVSLGNIVEVNCVFSLSLFLFNFDMLDWAREQPSNKGCASMSASAPVPV